MRFRSLTAALAALALSLGVMSGAQALDDPGSTTSAPSDSTDSTDSTDPTDSTGVTEPVADPAADPEVIAEQALDDAQALLDSDPVTVPDTDRDATLALRDLMLYRDELSARQRSSADRLLARPGSTRRKCATYTCVHWTTTGPNATRSTFARQVLATMESVHRTYVRAGYKAPKKDGNRGGNAKRDIYLRDLGAGFYGYCTSDDRPIGPPWRVAAFCALDNDYRVGQFGSRNTPIENMRVTAAHEYFHAVQFGYDYGEDGWFMESTAAWAEDELFDSIDDNRQYLFTGQSRRPRTSLDRYAFASYGQWIFFRYLTERVTASKGGVPILVRDMWRAAQYRRSQDRYSLQAIRSVLAGRKRPFAKTYAAFAAANLRPGQTYDEGATYPRPKPFATARLARDHRSSGWKGIRLDHLTSSTAVFTRDSGLGLGWKLKVVADMAPTVRGSRAVVTVFRTNGGAKVKKLTLNTEGNGQRTVSFGDSVVKVAVTLVNASTRTTCGPAKRKGEGTFACAGRPTDQDVKQRVRGKVLR